MQLRSILFLLFLFIFNQSFGFTFQCKVESCKDIEPPFGNESWCSQNFDDIKNTKFDSKNFELNEAGDVLIQMISDGDQYSQLTFNAKELKNLKYNTAITGIYTDNFWWYDGFHTRYELALNCKR